MAHLRCDFRSEALEMNTSMTVVLPESGSLSNKRVVYLLHGLEDNCSGWSRYTSVERYARKYELVLIIPEVQRSFYTDMKEGLKYFEFIHEELGRICSDFFSISQKRENTYVMGLSMGGYGALKCALTSPERYAGVAAFSAVTDIETATKERNDSSTKEFQAIFGDHIPDKDNLFKLIEKKESLPPIYLACGNEDKLLCESKAFYKELNERGADVTLEHWGGEHNWIFWDEAARRAFDFFFSKEA